MCGNSYNLNLIFENQSDLLFWLNNVFTDIYGYYGSFSIINLNELIYTTNEDCTEQSCIKQGCWLSDENGLKVVISENGLDYIQVENCN